MPHRLSNDEAAFRELARSGPDPRAAEIWDFERGEMRLEAFEKYLDVASHGEVVFAKFLALVWFGRDRYGLDVADIATILDADARALVAQWILAPIRP